MNKGVSFDFCPFRCFRPFRLVEPISAFYEQDRQEESDANCGAFSMQPLIFEEGLKLCAA